MFVYMCVFILFICIRLVCAYLCRLHLLIVRHQCPCDSHTNVPCPRWCASTTDCWPETVATLVPVPMASVHRRHREALTQRPDEIPTGHHLYERGTNESQKKNISTPLFLFATYQLAVVRTKQEPIHDGRPIVQHQNSRLVVHHCPTLKCNRQRSGTIHPRPHFVFVRAEQREIILQPAYKL